MELKIVDFEPGHQPFFKSLNLSWIEKYFKVEEIDENVLSFPEEYIFKDGGAILMALSDGKVVGTVALKKQDLRSFEMTKMAVDQDYQGAKIGYHLALAAIEKAKALGAEELVLYSQTVLAPAINLYKKVGFKEIPLEAGKYLRCNIKMKISFPVQEVISSLSSMLKNILEESMIKFNAIPEIQWQEKSCLAKWSKKEVLGHLIDSASNNHQRFVNIQYDEEKSFSKYEQRRWVEIQNYQHLPFPDLLSLWYLYNLHITRVISNIHYDKLYVKCLISNNPPISFHDLIVDYIQHLQHHVRQIIG